MANNSTDACRYIAVDPTFVAIAAVRAAVGTLSAVGCLLLIGLILLLKKYKYSQCQRLVLYLAVAAFVHSLSYPLARVNYYTPRQLLSPYCNFGGFLNLYTSWVEVMALSCLTVGGFINGILKKEFSAKVEYAYVATPYLLPLLWCWIPFIGQSFGSGSAWCDIRTITLDCQAFVYGRVLRFVVWYIPLTIILVCMFVIALVIFFRVRRRLKMCSEMKEWEKNDLKEVRFLTIYPIIYLVLNTFSLINRLDIAFQGNEAEVALYYLHILTSPLRGAVMAVVFVLDPDTLKRLSKPGVLFAGDSVNEYSMQVSDMSFSVHDDVEFNKYSSNLNDL